MAATAATTQTPIKRRVTENDVTTWYFIDDPKLETVGEVDQAHREAALEILPALKTYFNKKKKIKGNPDKLGLNQVEIDLCTRYMKPWTEKKTGDKIQTLPNTVPADLVWYVIRVYRP
jgi:hypothetical protein